MSAEFLVKLRDGAQMVADAAEEYLQMQAPADVRVKTEDFDKLLWSEKEGTKGSYGQTTKEANQNSEVFQALKQTLQDNKGFWQSSKHKYWTHRGNPDIIDRRKKEGKK